MREPVFTGACTAIVTPFDQSGAIDYGCFGRLIDQQLDHGVDAICVCGTTGESATLSIREHIAAVAFCVKRVNHRVKVIAGAGSNDTSAALYLSQHAQDSGADALLLVTPYYNKASQTGLIQHYTYIADRVELPILLYNVPSRTGVSLPPRPTSFSRSTPTSTGSRRPAETSPCSPTPAPSAAMTSTSGRATTIRWCHDESGGQGGRLRGGQSRP